MTDLDPQERPPYAAAALVGALILGVYLATLAPTTAFWDTSEYIAAARVLGIPHPPGNPLFTLLAHAWGLLPLAASYAVRINIFAAVTSVGASVLWFLVAERWLRRVVPVRWLRLAAAGMGVFVGATTWTVWNQSTVNEKVYTVSLFFIALVTWMATRWADEPEGERRDRWLVAIAYLLALTSTNHMMGVLAAPAVGLFVLMTDWRVLTRPRILSAVVVAGLVGISINYLFLPIRAAQYPPINEGEPVGFFSQALRDVLGRVQYGKPPVTQRQADFLSQLGNYWQYWSWQFARDWNAGAAAATGVFTALGALGLWTLWKADRRTGVAAGVLFLTLVPLLVYYLNFKYGFSMHPEQPDLPREVRERDYFFVASFQAFGILVAAGFAGVLRAIAGDAPAGDRRWLRGAPVLLLGLVPLLGNHTTASRAGETIARDFARDLLESVAPYGILVTAGDNDTFPLWYAQEVEGIRRDVTVANLSLMNTRWHLRQLQRRTPDPFDPARAATVWSEGGAAAGPLPVPATTTFGLPLEELDKLPEVTQVPERGGLQVDSLVIAFGQPYLQLQDLAVIAIIRENLRHRPIYFSWSDGGYPDQTLGLTPYLVTEGLARRLSPVPVRPGGAIVQSRGLGFVDVARTQRLLWEVYNWDAAARPRPRGWVDVPSSSILSLYGIIFDEYAQVARAQGDTALAVRADSVAFAVQQSLRPRSAP